MDKVIIIFISCGITGIIIGLGVLIMNIGFWFHKRKFYGLRENQDRCYGCGEIKDIVFYRPKTWDWPWKSTSMILCQQCWGKW